MDPTGEEKSHTVLCLQCYELFQPAGEEERSRERALKLKSEEWASLLGVTQKDYRGLMRR